MGISDVGVSSLTSLHYLRKSLGSFSLPCTQNWPQNTNRHHPHHHPHHHAETYVHPRLVEPVLCCNTTDSLWIKPLQRQEWSFKTDSMNTPLCPFSACSRAAPWPNPLRGWLQIYSTSVQTPQGLCQKGVSSLTSPHYIWRSFGPVSLLCAQNWP